MIKRGSKYVVVHPNFQPSPSHLIRQLLGNMKSGCPERREKKEELEISAAQGEPAFL